MVIVVRTKSIESNKKNCAKLIKIIKVRFWWDVSYRSSAQNIHGWYLGLSDDSKTTMQIVCINMIRFNDNGLSISVRVLELFWLAIRRGENNFFLFLTPRCVCLNWFETIVLSKQSCAEECARDVLIRRLLKIFHLQKNVARRNYPSPLNTPCQMLEN